MIKYYAEHPYEFIVDMFDWEGLPANGPTLQQKAALDVIPKAIKEGKYVGIKSGHGTGKTTMECWLIIWFMFTKPNPKIPCTAPTREGLYDVLWSELAKWHERFKAKELFEWTKTKFFAKSSPETWFATARTSNKPENMQGFHAEHLMFIVDEASGVDQEILQAIEGSQTQEGSIIIYLGNPTQVSGGLYDAFNSKRPFFHTFTFNSEESPLVKENYYKAIAAKYGRDSDIYRVRVLGEFPKAEPDTLISLDRVEKAAMREVETDPRFYETVEIGVDVARFGDDETVIMTRIQDKIILEKTLKKRDLMTVVGEVVNIANQYTATKTVLINIDDSGLGCLCKDTEVLTLNGWKKIQDVKSGEKIYSKDDENNVVIEKVEDNVFREPTRILENEQGYKFSFSHFLNYKTRKEYDYKLNNWESILNKKQVWLENDFNWRGEDVSLTVNKHVIEMPNGGHRTYNKKIDISPEILAELLGWIISEGHVNQGEIGITQSITSPYLDEIDNVLKKSGINYYIKKNKRKTVVFKIFNQTLINWCLKNCYTDKGRGCCYKKVPDIIKMGTKKTIKCFLESFRKGDGYIHHGVNEYVTSSKILADDLIELIYKTGKYGNIRIKQKKGSTSTINGRKITRTTDIYVVYEWKCKNITTFGGVKKDYIDNVYDLKISGSTRLFMCRFKDNRGFWVHNGGVTDRLKELTESGELRAEVYGVNNGAAAADSDKYVNCGTEMWFLMKEKIQDLDIPNDQDLIAQLSGRKYKLSSNGKTLVEPKHMMKDRGLVSPDRADAAILTLRSLIYGLSSDTRSACYAC